MDFREVAEIAYKLIRAITGLITAIAGYRAVTQMKKPTTRNSRKRRK